MVTVVPTPNVCELRGLFRSYCALDDDSALLLGTVPWSWPTWAWLPASAGRWGGGGSTGPGGSSLDQRAAGEGPVIVGTLLKIPPSSSACNRSASRRASTSKGRRSNYFCRWCSQTCCYTWPSALCYTPRRDGTRNAARRPGSGGRPWGCGFEEQGGGACTRIQRGSIRIQRGVYPYSHFVCLSVCLSVMSVRRILSCTFLYRRH